MSGCFLSEDLFIDDITTKSVTIEGGYGNNFTDINGMTSLNGNMIISNGTITIENFDIQ